MFTIAKIEETSEVGCYDRHELQNRGAAFGKIHDEIDEGISGLTVFEEELFHDLRNDDGEVGFQMISYVLVDERYLYHQLTLTEVVFDDVVQFIDDQLHEVSEDLIVLACDEIEQFD